MAPHITGPRRGWLRRVVSFAKGPSQLHRLVATAGWAPGGWQVVSIWSSFCASWYGRCHSRTVHSWGNIGWGVMLVLGGSLVEVKATFSMVGVQFFARLQRW
jgi:hypothetical protein